MKSILNMPVTRVQNKINDAKLRMDKFLFEKDLFFQTNELETNNAEFIAYCYIASPNNIKKFGILGYNVEEGNIEYVVEWVEMTNRNITEGMEDDPVSWLILKNEDEFAAYFLGVPLTQIISLRDKKVKK